MHEFCTLFDANYLARALVLHSSLVEAGEAFRLRAYCMDERSAGLLERLDLSGVEAITRAELEADDPELAAVQPTRSPVEYLWTATPAICLHALRREPALGSITYLDADLQFFSGPSAVFDEIGASSVTIVPHRYAPRWQAFEETSGIYNVEWLTFARDANGLEALTWWRERCLEWCYAGSRTASSATRRISTTGPSRFRACTCCSIPARASRPGISSSTTCARSPAAGGCWSTTCRSSSSTTTACSSSGRAASRAGSAPARARMRRRRPRRAGCSGGPATRSTRPRGCCGSPTCGRLIDAYERLRQLEPGFDAGIADPDLRELSAYTRVRVGSRLRARR